MPYTSAVTLSGINSAASGWSVPKRLGVGDRGSVLAIYAKANTSTVSQFRVEIGFGWQVSAASGAMSGVILPMNVPAAAGAWNVSGGYASATIFAYREDLTDATARYDFSNQIAAPFIYSGADIMGSGGLFARARGAAGGSAGAAVELTLYADMG